MEEVSALKVRVKYSKLGSLRYVGHLDVMRYFQKEIRRAKLKIKYSQGFSPHQIISFAAPLALGITSDGEYFDAEFEEVTTSAEMVSAMNAVSSEEMVVSKIVILPDQAKSAMAIVAASDYVISFKEMNSEAEAVLAAIDGFNALDEVMILKKTKKSEKEVNIKPGILEMRRDGDSIYMLLSTGSVYNLKPELVLTVLYDFAGFSYDFFKVRIHRLETYMEQGPDLVPLYEAGEEF